MNRDKPPSPPCDQPPDMEAAMDIDQEDEACKHSQPPHDHTQIPPFLFPGRKTKPPFEDGRQPPGCSSLTQSPPHEPHKLLFTLRSTSATCQKERPTNQFSQLAIHDKELSQITCKSLGKRPVVHVPKQSPAAPKEASLGEIRHAIDNPIECVRLIREQELLLASYQKQNPQVSSSSSAHPTPVKRQLSFETANMVMPHTALLFSDDDQGASPPKKPCHLDPIERAGLPTALRSQLSMPKGPPPSPDKPYVPQRAGFGPEVPYKLPVGLSSSNDRLLPGQTILNPKPRTTPPQKQTDPVPVPQGPQQRPTVAVRSLPGWKREDSPSDSDSDSDSD